MIALLNAGKARAAAMLAQQAQLRYGTVASVDGARHRVKVTLQPEGTVTGWLPVLTTAAGAGWGLLALPLPGMQVALMGEGGSNTNLLVMGAVHSTADQPPAPAAAIGAGGTPSGASVPGAAGELLLVHSSGSALRLCADGSIYLRPASGTLGIDGSLRVNGDVSDRHGSLDRLRMAHDGHVHGNVQNGGGQTSGPSIVDPE